MGKPKDSGPSKAETGGAPKGSMATSTKKRYWDAGKGSRRRDSINQTKYEENWERIFGKKENETINK